ncbi:hypothetical protein Ciccas_013210 [Cichlidogyrus casuarinus]|uniref:Eukaryotic elongation factor 2 kinase n=1 Tax=Cichlidogyrus casuarinus TaxID=1844966 RepID=A0ABD2PLZ1_9PLAT
MKGYQLMMAAARFGDRSAMLFIAETNYLGSKENDFQADWNVAQHWYNQALPVTTNNSKADESSDSHEMHDHGISMSFSSLDEWPLHRLYARIAELYTKGGHGLPKNHPKACEINYSLLNICEVE